MDLSSGGDAIWSNELLPSNFGAHRTACQGGATRCCFPLIVEIKCEGLSDLTTGVPLAPQMGRNIFHACARMSYDELLNGLHGWLPQSVKTAIGCQRLERTIMLSRVSLPYAQHFVLIQANNCDLILQFLKSNSADYTISLLFCRTPPPPLPNLNNDTNSLAVRDNNSSSSGSFRFNPNAETFTHVGGLYAAPNHLTASAWNPLRGYGMTYTTNHFDFNLDGYNDGLNEYLGPHVTQPIQPHRGRRGRRTALVSGPSLSYSMSGPSHLPDRLKRTANNKSKSRSPSQKSVNIAEERAGKDSTTLGAKGDTSSKTSINTLASIADQSSARNVPIHPKTHDTKADDGHPEAQPQSLRGHSSQSIESHKGTDDVAPKTRSSAPMVEHDHSGLHVPDPKVVQELDETIDEILQEIADNEARKTDQSRSS